MIEVRPATPADASDLAELRWEFRTSRAPAAEDREAFIRRCAEWMRRELTSGDSWRAWVAVSDRRIVGHVWLDTVEKVPNPVAERERHAYVSNLYNSKSSQYPLKPRYSDSAGAGWGQDFA